MLNANLTVNTVVHLTINGPISGSGGLVKTSAGVLTLGGANTYSGPTTINAGTVKIAATGSLNASVNGITLNGGTLIVNSTTPLTRSITFGGGTFGGTDRYVGNLTPGSGHLSPGDSGVGTMTQQGNLTLAAGSVLDFDLGDGGFIGLLGIRRVRLQFSFGRHA